MGNDCVTPQIAGNEMITTYSASQEWLLEQRRAHALEAAARRQPATAQLPVSNTASSTSACSNVFQSPVQQAETRAKDLGLVPNSRVNSLPMNQPHEATLLEGFGDSTEAHAGDSQPLGGRVTNRYFTLLRQQAEHHLSRNVPSANYIESLGLLFTHVRQGGRALLRLAQKNERNDQMIAALERAAGDETSFPEEELGNTLLAYSPSLPFVIGDRGPSRFFSGNDVDRFLALVRMLGVPLIDRTGVFSSGLKVNVIDPIPKFDPSFSLSLEEVIRERCRYLLKAHSRLHLLWSGGIDSTSVIVGFLRVASEDDWKTKLSVHYCHKSIGERPRFYENYIKRLPHHEQIKGHLRDFIDGARIVVTGDPADMLFGTHFMANAFAGEEVQLDCHEFEKDTMRVNQKKVKNPMYYALDKPWKQVVPSMLRVRGLLAPGIAAERDWFRWMEPQVSLAPIPIESLFDWLWWIVYSCKYQFDITRLFYNRSEVTHQLIDSVVNFYQSHDWHQWSFHNHASKMVDKSVWASYKLPLKQWIFDFDGDAEQYAGKVKLQSTFTPWGFQLGIDDNLNILHFGVLTVSRLKMEQKYGNSLNRFLDVPPVLTATISHVSPDTLEVCCTRLSGDVFRTFSFDVSDAVAALESHIMSMLQSSLKITFFSDAGFEVPKETPLQNFEILTIGIELVGAPRGGGCRPAAGLDGGADMGG